jgi:hypothetical protein
VMRSSGAGIESYATGNETRYKTPVGLLSGSYSSRPHQA